MNKITTLNSADLIYVFGGKERKENKKHLKPPKTYFDIIANVLSYCDKHDIAISTILLGAGAAGFLVNHLTKQNQAIKGIAAAGFFGGTAYLLLMKWRVYKYITTT